MPVEPERIRKLNSAPERGDREFVLYWTGANRRVASNHALLHAVEIANRLHLPVLFYEGLSCTYPEASDRFHTFILEGVPDTAAALRKAGIGYCFNLRARPEDPLRALVELSKKAAAIVADDYPTFYPRFLNDRAPELVDVAYSVVDSSCIVPMRALPKREFGAYTIRPKIKRLLPQYLKAADALKPKHRFTAAIPSFHTEVTREDIPRLVSECAINHGVKPSTDFRGGSAEAHRLLKQFLSRNLARFANFRNEPCEHATSHMSPYLHFGNISSLEIALAVEKFGAEHKIATDTYLEELIVRRELAFNYCAHVADPASLQNVPEWAQKTMREHVKDPRDPLYTPEQLENAETYDALWNATQQEMLLRGKIHGYYRMYWGKKIIEWSRTYEEAVQTMIDIHTRYALDGRDPNTYTNVLWCFGLHDRAWGERPIFGKLRYMSLEGMRRKTNTSAYISEIESLRRSTAAAYSRTSRYSPA